MAHANRGTKRRCGTCGAPFYDLNHDPIICPKCQSPYQASARPSVRAVRARMIEAPPPDVEEVEAFEEDEVLEHDEDSEDTPLTHDDVDHDDELRE